MARRRTCQKAIDTDLHSLVCRRGLDHQGDHAYWSSAMRVEWNDQGMVLAAKGAAVWKPGKVYATRVVQR